MTQVSAENKTIAKTIVTAVGGTPEVTRFWDEEKRYYIDLLSLQNQPTNGVMTVASLGVSDTPLYLHDKEYPVRIEMLGCCGSKQAELFPNLVATASFYIIRNHWFCAPGIIYPDIISMYYPDSPMKHLYFTTPFLWEDSLSVTELVTKKVAFLLIVPVSESERCFAVENSPRDLENIFERENIDIFDLYRKSVL